MSYLAIAYPKLSEEDFGWIQQYREVNDARYFSVVKPHFTLVFPVVSLSENEFVNEIEKQLSGIQTFDFKINVSTINYDSFGKFYHEFLVPDKGYSHIVKLHDKLYSDLLLKELRFDIDFIPHIGIGNSDDPLVSKARIDQLNYQGLNITGRIETVDVVEFTGDTVRTIKIFAL